MHLKPEEVNKLVEERGDEVVFFDGRNAFEAKIGKFKNAVVPDVRTTHDFIREIESGKYDDLKDKPRRHLLHRRHSMRNPLRPHEEPRI